MANKTYVLTENQLRRAFEHRFHEIGEIWFPTGNKRWLNDIMKLNYSRIEAAALMERECHNVTEMIFQEFMKEIEKVLCVDTYFKERIE